MLEVRLLGEARVGGDDAHDRQPSPRGVALLAYLVLTTGAAQSRQRLAGIFWPDSGEQQARTNLRRELHHLRGALADDPSLVVTASTLAWQDAPSCRVDVRRFQLARGAALRAEAADDGSAFLPAAEAALAEYRGDLLPGSYDEWVLEHRDALRGDCVDLCDRLAARWRDAGDLDRAVRVARRRIVLEPLGESGYRDLMRLQAEAGDRAAAMSTYHRCAAVLERELGIGPDPETVRALDRLLGAGGSAPRVPRPRVARLGGVTGLVGRAGEAGALLGHWQQAAAGRAALVLVSGEAGVGKSRLVAGLTETARGSGAAVATARCFGTSGRLPLAPVADWLRSPDLQASLDALGPGWRAEVDRLVPAATAPPASAGGRPRAREDAWQRHRLFEGLARAVLAPGRPTLLVLDDLQWCDDETTAWLTFLLGFASDAPLLVAATVRNDEPEGASLALRTLRGSGLVREIALTPLDPAGAEELAETVRGRALSSGERAFVHAATGGYPLFVVEAARGLPERPGAGSAPLPAAQLHEVLRHRLEDTSVAAREVAGLAAAVGRDFGLDLLTEASDLDAESLVHAVDELWRRRILREQGGGYDFSHDLLRDAAYALVTPPRRWLLHRRLAQGLELLHAGRLDEVASLLADQYDRGGRADRALHYLGRSAAMAEAVFASAEAVRHHRRALALVASLPAGHDRDSRELEALQSMIPSLTAVRGYAAPDVQEALDRTAALAERLGRRATLLGALVALSSTHFVRGHVAVAMDLGARSLELARHGVDASLVAQAHFAFASAAGSMGMPEAAVEHFALACELAPDGVTTMLGTSLAVHARAWSAHAQWLRGRDAQAGAEAGRAIETARAIEHPWSLAVALSYASVTAQLRGDRGALPGLTAELRGLCERYDFPYYLEWADVLAGWAAGDEAGLTRVRGGLDRLRGQGAFARMPYWLSLEADLLTRLGRDDAARAVLDGARAGALQRDDRWWLPDVLRRRAALEPGPAGVRLLEQAAALALHQESPALEALARADLAAREPGLDLRHPAVRSP